MQHHLLKQFQFRATLLAIDSSLITSRLMQSLLQSCIEKDGRLRSSFMTSISLCKVGVKVMLIVNALPMLLLVSTLHNDVSG